MTLDQALKGEYSFYQDPVTALKAYHEYGFHVEHNVFDHARCQQLIALGYELAHSKKRDYKPYMMPHRECPAFVDALKDRKIVSIIDKLVGGKSAGLQSQFFYCKPETRGFSLHQDNFFVQAELDVFVSAWVALVNTNANNGGLIIYPGTHKEGLLPVRKLHLDEDVNQDPNANNEETIVPEKYPAVNLTINEGSVLFIHAYLVHGSNPNKSEHGRYVLLNTYIRSGATFRKGNYAQREEIALV